MLRTALALTVLLCSLLSGCSADFIPFSGGKLQGEEMEVPADWEMLRAIDVIELETNPAEPYSVKLWIIAIDSVLYIHAGANRATWVEHIEVDSTVRLKVGDAIYQLSAARVGSQAEFDRFSDTYETKYGSRPRNEDVAQAYLFRLTPDEPISQ